MNVVWKAVTKLAVISLNRCIQSSRRLNLVSLRNKTGFTMLLNSTLLTEQHDEIENDVVELKNMNVHDFSDLLKEACDLTEQRIKELIKLIQVSIEKSSDEYRKNVKKQIDILKHGSEGNEDPLSPYWDELVKYRVEAENLKLEILKFQSLVEYVEKLITNLNMCQSLMEDNNFVKAIDKNFPLIEKDLQTLKELKEEQIKLNKKAENELLKSNIFHILKSAKT